MRLRDELDKAIAAEESGATPDTWLGYMKAHRWAIMAIVAMFVVVLWGIFR